MHYIKIIKKIGVFKKGQEIIVSEKRKFEMVVQGKAIAIKRVPRNIMKIKRGSIYRTFFIPEEVLTQSNLKKYKEATKQWMKENYLTGYKKKKVNKI